MMKLAEPSSTVCVPLSLWFYVVLKPYSNVLKNVPKQQDAYSNIGKQEKEKGKEFWEPHLKLSILFYDKFDIGYNLGWNFFFFFKKSFQPADSL